MAKKKGKNAAKKNNQQKNKPVNNVVKEVIKEIEETLTEEPVIETETVETKEAEKVEIKEPVKEAEKPKKTENAKPKKESDKKDSLKTTAISQDKLKWILIAAGAIFIVVIAVRFVVLEKKVSDLSQKVTLLTDQKNEIVDEKNKKEEELKEQISLLSGKVNESIAKEGEEETKRIPDALPVTGKVSILEEPLSPEEIAALEAEAEPGEGNVEIREDNKIVVFGAQNGSTVIAAGNGVVEAIEADENYGYVVKINHGNDYVTLYRCNTEPKVKAGDEILKGQLIYDITQNNTSVGYQILYKEECINPMDIMEING